MIAVLLVGFGFRVWGLTWGLANADVSRRPHPDEWPVYWLFNWFTATGTLNPCPRPPGQCFFDWGSVFPYLAFALRGILSPLFALFPPEVFGPRADPRFVYDVLAARGVSALLSTLTILVTYALGREAIDRRVGLVAAAAIALSALPIQLAHFGTPDSTSGLLVAVTLWQAVRLARVPTGRTLLLAAALVGVATGTEYNLAVLALPVAAACLVAGVRDLRRLSLAAAVAAGAFLLTNPYILVDLPAFAGAAVHTLRIRTVDSAAQYGDRWAAYGPAWLYVVRFALAYGVGVPVTVWFVAGAATALWRRSRNDLILLAWIVPYGLLVTVSPAKFMRYSAPLIAPLAVLAAALAVRAVATWNPTLRGAVVAAIGGSLLYAALYDAAYAGLFTSRDPRVAAAQAVLAQPGSTRGVAFEQLPNGLVNLPYFVDGLGPRSCFTGFSTRRLAGARYLLLDRYALEEHPRVSSAQVRDFLASVRRTPGYQLVRRIAYTPTFLGLAFPITGSPHDWRYPSHEISIYRIPASVANRPAGSQCYPTVAAAIKVLYPRLLRR